MTIIILVGLLCLLFGCLLGFLVRYAYGKTRLTSIEQKATRIEKEAIHEAEKEKDRIILKAREDIANMKFDLDKEVRSTRSELQVTERRLQSKEENLERKQADLEIYKQSLSDKEIGLNARESELNEAKTQIEKEKERIIGMTKDQVKSEMVASLEDVARQDAYAYVKKIEMEAHQEAEKKARHIVIETMQRLASEVASVPPVVSTVSIPSEEMKGRIIGKEGRNIRSLEVLTGVDIVIDDTPDAVVVSCFDPIRREIAKRALEVLVSDGRIHPTRIEEVVNKVTREIRRIQYEEGEKIAMELGFNSMSQGLIRALGRLYFRYSYSQNVLYHSRECAYIAAMIAHEVGADAEVAKRAALLHDIGKGAQIATEEGHALYGAKLARDLGESEEVVHAIASHHDDETPHSIEALIVRIADSISASRPGARSDTVDNYTKRLENLENIALSFEGVEKAYAIQAGREVRVIVNNAKISDDKAHEIAKKIADRIKAECKFPGKIRITLTRESRFVEYAS